MNTATTPRMDEAVIFLFFVLGACVGLLLYFIFTIQLTVTTPQPTVQLTPIESEASWMEV